MTCPGCECSVPYVVNDLKESKQRATFVVDEKMDMEAPIEFSEWYAAEYSRLVNLLALSTGSREVGEDAAAEAFSRAYEKWDRVRRMATPTGWTYTVGLNVARRKMRHVSRLRERYFADTKLPRSLPRLLIYLNLGRLSRTSRTDSEQRFCCDTTPTYPSPRSQRS